MDRPIVYGPTLVHLYLLHGSPSRSRTLLLAFPSMGMPRKLQYVAPLADVRPWRTPDMQVSGGKETTTLRDWWLGYKTRLKSSQV